MNLYSIYFKTYCLLFFLGCVIVTEKEACAQGTLIDFESPEHNFGKVREEEGPVVYEFKFTNKGTSPAIITNVQASCGCTTPEWSRDPVQPGKSGFIKAEYNPINRPGVFEKALTVTANTEPAT